MTTEEPLVYTIRGNVPINSLRYETAWDVQDTYIEFVERYLDPETGEVVKESAHVYDRSGIFAGGIAAAIG